MVVIDAAEKACNNNDKHIMDDLRPLVWVSPVRTPVPSPCPPSPAITQTLFSTLLVPLTMAKSHAIYIDSLIR